MTEERTATNYLGIAMIVLLVTLIGVMIYGIVSINQRIGDNERIVAEGLRDDIPEPFDATHIPCKSCRGHINDVASHTAELERAEVIYMLKRSRTGHAAFDSGVDKCIELIRRRGE